MATNKKNKEERQLDELEKFLLTHRSKLQKEEQKSIDDTFDTSFSMEKNFLAIQAKIKNEQANRLEPKNIIEERAKKLMQIETREEEITKSWVKPSPISSQKNTTDTTNQTAKSVSIGNQEIKREVNNWVKPSPVSSPYSSENYSLATQNQENKPAKTVSIRKFWTVAASLTALLVTTFMYQMDTISMLTAENEELISMYEGNGMSGFDENNEENGNYSQNVSLPAELIEAENYYTSIIAKEKTTLKKKDTENLLAPETIQTLDELDEAYQVMKSDLLGEQNPKKLVDEMLDNLKLRKQILDESIEILEKTNTEKTNSSDSKTNKNT
jgi:hypothetical protein